jgi:iron(III) transport system ATP-binding protein
VASHPAVNATKAEAYLMIRPETISLRPADEGGIGTVLRSTFHGHSVDYEVETISGTLHVTDAGPDPDRLLGVGTNVAVTLNPDRAYVLNGA